MDRRCERVRDLRHRCALLVDRMTTRRSFIRSAALLFAAPAIVKVSSLMSIKPLPFVYEYPWLIGGGSIYRVYWSEQDGLILYDAVQITHD